MASRAINLPLGASFSSSEEAREEEEEEEEAEGGWD